MVVSSSSDKRLLQGSWAKSRLVRRAQERDENKPFELDVQEAQPQCALALCRYVHQIVQALKEQRLMLLCRLALPF